MDPSVTEEKIFAAIGRSASVVLSNQINQHLLQYFSVSEILLMVVCMQAFISSIPSVPGFNASWHLLNDITQSIVIQALANYVSSGQNAVVIVFDLVLVIQVLDWVPAATGWVGKDIESFTTNVTYIFADQLSGLLSSLGVPLFGAALGICMRGQGLLGKTLAYTGVTTLCTFLFTSVAGTGELSLSWPVFVLYFVSEICRSYQFQDFLEFGLFKASDAAFSGLQAFNVGPDVIALGFAILLMVRPTDTVWTGICALVFVNAGASWVLGKINFISSTDPVLAGLVVVTFVHFASIALQTPARELEKKLEG